MPPDQKAFVNLVADSLRQGLSTGIRFGRERHLAAGPLARGPGPGGCATGLGEAVCCSCFRDIENVDKHVGSKKCFVAVQVFGLTSITGAYPQASTAYPQFVSRFF